MAPLPLPQPQDSQPQAPVRQLQPQEFDPLDPPQEFQAHALAKLLQEFDPSQESDPVDPPEESESPSPRIVILNMAEKLAHKLLAKWYKQAGKVSNDEDHEATAANHSRPPRICRGFDPCDLSQNAVRYVAGIRPTEPETFNVTDDYVIVKTYKSDAEEDNANGEKAEEANDTEKDNDAEEDNDTKDILRKITILRKIMIMRNIIILKKIMILRKMVILRKIMMRTIKEIRQL